MRATLKKQLLMATLCLTLPLSIYAEDYAPNPNPSSSQGGEALELLVKYLRNLGQYMGYDLTAEPPQDTSTTDTLMTYLSVEKTLGQQIFEQTAWVTILGATPMTVGNNTPAFVPKGDPAEALNKQANFTFQHYNSPNSGTISILKGIDQSTQQNQQTYQGDPGSQAVVNLLATPDFSFCPPPSNDLSTNNDCLSQKKIMDTVLQDMVDEHGLLPGASTLYHSNYAASIANQLSSNTLLGPLLYSKDAPSSQNTQEQGIPSTTQEQQAANFVRYATYGFAPSGFIDQDSYNNLWKAAYPNGVATLDTDPNARQQQQQAQSDLATYLTTLRAFTAQSSVAINNLYSILSKRIPQTNGQNNNTSSQALSEYQLATWRIYNTQQKQQWMDELNKASTSTVQKEIAILLAEMNYQLYLNRQQEERLLLTNSLLLLQQLNTNKPTPPATGNAPDPKAVPGT